jgi:hypothetical protein
MKKYVERGQTVTLQQVTFHRAPTGIAAEYGDLVTGKVLQVLLSEKHPDTDVVLVALDEELPPANRKYMVRARIHCGMSLYGSLPSPGTEAERRDWIERHIQFLKHIAARAHQRAGAFEEELDELKRLKSNKQLPMVVAFQYGSLMDSVQAVQEAMRKTGVELGTSYAKEIIEAVLAELEIEPRIPLRRKYDRKSKIRSRKNR